MKARCQSTYREDEDDKRHEYAGRGAAAHIILHREGTEDNEGGKVIVSSTKPFPGQRTESIFKTLQTTQSRGSVDREGRRRVCMVFTVDVSFVVTK